MTRTYIGVDEGADVKRHAVQRTDGADTVFQPYSVEAEPEIASYRIASGSAASTATSNSHLIQIMAGASLRVCVRRITVYQAGNAASTGADQFAIYRLTSAGTGGTSLTPAPLDPADSAAGATAMLLPTSKGTESTLIEYRQVILHATEATVGLNPIAVFEFERERTKGLWIAAGTSNGIALKNVTSDASASVRIVAEIVETSVA